MTISQGTQFGPYKILELIGSGGMGEVYRALDTRLEREVALKLVSDQYLAAELGSGSPSPAGTPHTRGHLSHERFLREARSAATLSHANICAIFDTGEQDGRPYLVMELLRGETLKQYLVKRGTEEALAAEEVVAFSQQAAAALVAAHAKGIVHRDIKPANLFVNDAGRGRRQIKILDFGLAKKQGTEASPDSRTVSAGGSGDATGSTAGAMELTSPGSTIGTIAYMSPEQAKGQPLDARTDLFSLGSVVYEMATGKRPFGGQSTAEVFVALLTKDPVAVTAVNGAMPAELDAIVAKLLRKETAERYQSAEELLQDLEAMSGQGSSASVRVASASGVAASGAAASGSHAAASGVDARRAEREQRGEQKPGDRERVRERRRGDRNPAIAVVVVVLLLLAGAGFLWWKHKAGSGTSGAAPVVVRVQGSGDTAAGTKNAIIVADFVNQTGDPVFETTLNQALAVQLGQSPVLDIVSQQHLRQSLQYLGKKPDETITPSIAREIGEREGIKAILTGTISNLGNDYVITLAAQNTATGDQIASVEAQAAGKEKILDALNQAAAQMRAKLGESLASIAKLNTPFGQATTPSLEAFRAYALGDEAHQKGNDIPEAQDHYKRALELDPRLAMAWARLGVILLNSGQHGKAMEYFTKAHQLSGDVSERERLYIEGHYYSEVLGDIGKAIETLEVAIQEYPLQVDNYVNLGALYETVGEPEKAQKILMKALEVQPDEAVGLADVIAADIQLDQTSGAVKTLDYEKKLGINDTGSLQYVAALYGVSGDMGALQKIVAETAGRPDQFLITSQLGIMQAQWGQFRQATVSLKQSAEQAGAAGAPDAAAGLILNAAYVGWPIGECEDPDGAVKKALALDKSKPTLIAIAATEAYCGNAKAALPALDMLEKKYPQDTLIQKEIVPQGRAYLALQAGEAQKSLDLLQRSEAFDLVSPGPYLRGMAYLELKDAASAISAFKIATKYKGVNYLSESNLFYPMNYYALALLGLGRAYAMAGDKADAKAAYEHFFTEWKNADPGLAVVAAAKKEYAGL